jgi:L-ascorbate metabolism protein UlaG (beta-lactamase superfamily)
MATMQVTYLGAAALEAADGSGARILIDPYLTDNPLTGRTPRDFYGVDLILVTHAAFDHLGDTVDIMKNGRARLIAGLEVCEMCVEAGIPPERTWTTVQGDRREHKGFVVRTVEARHVSFLKGKDRVTSGVPFGYVLTSAGGIGLYHPGDTSLFSDMRLVRELYRPRIMLVGVDRIGEPYPCEMTPAEAALATRWVGPDVVIPAHYPEGSTAPAEFRAQVAVQAPDVEVFEAVDRPFVYHKYRLECA